MTNSLTVVAKVFFKYIDIFAAKNVSSFCNANATHVFNQNINVFAIFQDRNFNITIALLSFEQLAQDEWQTV